MTGHEYSIPQIDLQIRSTSSEIMAEEPVAVTNTLASPLGPDRVGQVCFPFIWTGHSQSHSPVEKC